MFYTYLKLLSNYYIRQQFSVQPSIADKRQYCAFISVTAQQKILLLAGHTKACLNKCWFAVIRSTHVTIARFMKVYNTSQIQLSLRSKSAANNTNNTNLQKVSGFKSSQRIRMKRWNSNGVQGLYWGHDVNPIIFQIREKSKQIYKPEGADNVSIPIRTYIGTAPQHFHSIAIPELSDYREYQTDTNHLQQSHLHLL